MLEFSLHGNFADEIADILVGRQIPFLFVTGYDESLFPDYRDVPPFAHNALQSAIEALLPHG